MRKAANLKKYSPIPIPRKGTVFNIDEHKFTVKNVSNYQNENKEHVVQCEIETESCRMIILLMSHQPFLTEDNNG